MNMGPRAAAGWGAAPGWRGVALCVAAVLFLACCLPAPVNAQASGRRGPTAGERTAGERTAGERTAGSGGRVANGQGSSSTGKPSDVAFVGVTVIDVASGRRIADATVVMAARRITAVGPARSVRVPRGVRAIDARGRFMIPGLWDMHVEQALPLWDRAPVDSNAAFFHPLLLAHGVTGVRDVAGPLDVVARWRAAIDGGARVGPRIVYTGPKLGMQAVAPGAPFPVADAASIERSVAALARGGAVGAYVFELDPSLAGALFAAAKHERLTVEGGVPLTTTLWAASAGGQRVVDHMDGVLRASNRDESSIQRTLRTNEEQPWWARAAWRLGIMTRPPYPQALALDGWSQPRAESLFALLAKQRTYQVPTLRLLSVLNRSGDSAVRLPPSPLVLRPPRHPWNGWANEPYAASHPIARVMEKARWSVAAMQRAGVPILAGSDTPNLYAAPGVSLHDELELLVRAGLSPLDALRSATLRPAEYLAATDSLGTVAAGKVADVVVLEGDPLADIRNTRRIEWVVARGVAYDRAALDALRARGETMAREIGQYWLARRERAP